LDKEIFRTAIRTEKKEPSEGFKVKCTREKEKAGPKKKQSHRCAWKSSGKEKEKTKGRKMFPPQ